ncbi:UNVERIFIED_CONTAM: Calcium-transporting ATPase 4, endoplasmic reticulum-type, partial [Sesamum latifolium]
MFCDPLMWKELPMIHSMGKIENWATSQLDPNLQVIAKIAAICNDADIEKSGHDKFGHYVADGVPTEAALKVLVEKMGLPDELGSGPSYGYDGALRCSYLWNKIDQQIATLEFVLDRKGSHCEFYHCKKYLLVKEFSPSAQGFHCRAFISGIPLSILLVIQNGTMMPISTTMNSVLPICSLACVFCVPTGIELLELGVLISFNFYTQLPIILDASAQLKEATETDHQVEKVAEGGKGPNVLGQVVLHFAAALGYDWAIPPTIATAGVSVCEETAADNVCEPMLNLRLCSRLQVLDYKEVQSSLECSVSFEYRVLITLGDRLTPHLDAKVAE